VEGGDSGESSAHRIKNRAIHTFIPAIIAKRIRLILKKDEEK